MLADFILVWCVTGWTFFNIVECFLISSRVLSFFKRFLCIVKCGFLNGVVKYVVVFLWEIEFFDSWNI